MPLSCQPPSTRVQIGVGGMVGNLEDEVHRQLVADVEAAHSCSRDPVARRSIALAGVSFDVPYVYAVWNDQPFE